MPALPVIDAGELWDRAGQQMYDQLRHRERTLVDWALELEAIALEICE